MEIESGIAALSENLWTWIVLPVVVLLGVYFTVRSGAVQVRLLPQMVRTLRDRTPTDASGRPQSLSSFQAFTVSAASRVGIGNIAGVGTAIAVGGPGAIFWMWAMALLGGAASFIESTLGQLYKRRDAQGFRGGPAYYMERGLRSRGLGVVFAVVLIVSTPLAINSLQSFTISETVASALDTPASTGLTGVVGLVVAGLTAAVVLGGVRRIAKVTETLVPAMAVLYLVLGIVIVAVNIDQLGGVLTSIWDDAISGRAVAGGALGSVILVGVQRGIFSNEAGLGTAPHAAASAAVTHPAKQGLVQTLGVYFDTFIVCSITAVIVLVSNPDLGSAERGISLTHNAVVGTLGPWAGYLLAFIVFLLAFSTILGCYFYGEANLEYITSRRWALALYRTLAIGAVLGGAMASASLVWTTADLLMGVMATINLVAIALLSPQAFRLLKDFTAKLRRGEDPVFTRADLPGVAHIDEWESIEAVTGVDRVGVAEEAGGAESAR